MIRRKRKLNSNENVHPIEEDEPPFICRLFGSSYSVYVDLCGWSSIVPVKMGDINLKETTRFANMVDEVTRKLHPKAKDYLEAYTPVTIREASDYVGYNKNREVTTVLIVQVVAKRKVEVTVVKGRVFVIPTLVVADTSGYCMLTSMNEGLKVVYNALDVGDVLFLTRFQTLLPKVAVHRGLFSDQHFVNMEIKFQFHSARHHYHYKFNPDKSTISPYFKMSEKLFDDQFKLLMPSELQSALISGSLNTGLTYFDIVGVVTYVGRIERHQITTQPITVEGIDKQVITVPKFIMYRWIKIIDRTCKPLPIKVYILNQTLDCQTDLIPGAHIVINHCVMKDDQYTTCTYISTSEFSHIFLETKLTSYFRQRPVSVWSKANSVIGKVSYKDILTREDFVFCIGGTVHPETIAESKFKSMYEAKSKVLYHGIHTRMNRRESRYLFIKGVIVRAFEVLNEEQHESLRYIQIYDNNRPGITTAYPWSTNLFQPTVTTWFSFVKKLPTLNPDVLLEPTSRSMCKRVTQEYGSYCGPLLLPAKKTAWQDFDHFTDLTSLDGPPHIEIDIFNEVTQTEWRCIWKHPGVSREAKVSKIQSSSNKTVICLVEAFCLENDSPIEISLIDFVMENLTRNV